MSGINHATVAGPKATSTDYYGDHLIADASIPVAKISGLGTAATHAATDFDVSGAAATAQTTAEAYTDSSVAVLLTQSQVLARGLGA